MKSLLKSVLAVFIFSYILTACSKPSPRDLVVMEHEQTMEEGVKIDLNMKIISSEDIGVITGMDSLDYCHQKELDRYSGWKDSSLDGVIAELKKRNFNGRIEALKIYYDRREELLGKKVKYIYKINNPMLNYVEQEITKTYIFSPDETKILTTL